MASSSKYAFFHCHYEFQKFPIFCVTLHNPDIYLTSMRKPTKSSVRKGNLQSEILKGAIHSQLNWAILLCDVIPV